MKTTEKRKSLFAVGFIFLKLTRPTCCGSIKYIIKFYDIVILFKKFFFFFFT